MCFASQLPNSSIDLAVGEVCTFTFEDQHGVVILESLFDFCNSNRHVLEACQPHNSLQTMGVILRTAGHEYSPFTVHWNLVGTTTAATITTISFKKNDMLEMKTSIIWYIWSKSLLFVSSIKFPVAPDTCSSNCTLSLSYQAWCAARSYNLCPPEDALWGHQLHGYGSRFLYQKNNKFGHIHVIFMFGNLVQYEAISFILLLNTDTFFFNIQGIQKKDLQLGLIVKPTRNSPCEATCCLVFWRIFPEIMSSHHTQALSVFEDPIQPFLDC